jgi:hypothetical protein
MFKLRGLDPEATYRVTHLDLREAFDTTGQALCEKGLPVTLGEQPGAAIFRYRRI